MLTRLTIAAVVLFSGAAFAQVVPLDDAAITMVLSGQSLTYDDGTKQVFKADGQTIFDNGTQSLGRWRVQGDRYCSLWPPSDRWACYDVTQSADGLAISFVADDGSTSTGQVVK